MYLKYVPVFIFIPPFFLTGPNLEVICVRKKNLFYLSFLFFFLCLRNSTFCGWSERERPVKVGLYFDAACHCYFEIVPRGLKARVNRSLFSLTRFMAGGRCALILNLQCPASSCLSSVYYINKIGRADDVIAMTSALAIYSETIECDQGLGESIPVKQTFEQWKITFHTEMTSINSLGPYW